MSSGKKIPGKRWAMAWARIIVNSGLAISAFLSLWVMAAMLGAPPWDKAAFIEAVGWAWIGPACFPGFVLLFWSQSRGRQ